MQNRCKLGPEVDAKKHVKKVRKKSLKFVYFVILTYDPSNFPPKMVDYKFDTCNLNSNLKLLKILYFQG